MMFSINLENPAGKRLVLIPGNDLCAAFYQPLGERLVARGFSVRLLTLPGFHGTPPLDAPGIEPLVGALVEQLGPKTTLVGHSLGGLLAVLVAARAADRIERLILMEPAIWPFRWLARKAAKKYRRDVVDAPRDHFEAWSGSYWRVADVEKFPRQAIDLYREVRRTTDPQVTLSLLEDLPSVYPLPFDAVKMPVLILSGDYTGALTFFGIPWIEGALHARHQVIERAAHWMANEQDDAIALAIAHFSA